MKDTALTTARQLSDSGFTYAPLHTKDKPAVKWGELRKRQPTREEIQDWFGNGSSLGIALICGRLPGEKLNLEVVDIDDGSLIRPFEKQLKNTVPGLLERLVRVQSPRDGGGRHYAYLYRGRSQKGKKLAVAVRDGKLSTLIEARGAGHYVVTPGSPPTVHPSGRPYRYLKGSFKYSEIQEITAAEREQLLELARSFTETTVTETNDTERGSVELNTGRPGDDFNINGPSWEELLTPHGWQTKDAVGPITYWTRPGKDPASGHSATTGFVTESGRELFCVHSTNAAPFSEGGRYDRFGTLARLEFDGDLAVTALKLAEAGYGTQDDTPDSMGDRITATAFSTIRSRKVHWLWKDRIATGKLTVLSGDPSVGKSFLFCDIAARISKGRDFPDGSPAPRGDFLFFSSEDDPADTLRPRLDAHKADVSRVHFLTVETEEGAFQQLDVSAHLDQLGQVLTEYPQARVLLFDPLTAFLGNVDSNSNTEVRRVLGPLCEIARHHEVAVIGISHLSKKEQRAVARTLGSMAFVAAARANWMVCRDSQDRDRRLFLQAKNNLADAPGLAFRIVDGRVEWEPDPVYDDPDIPTAKMTTKDLALMLLETELANGSVPQTELVQKAKIKGISRRTLDTAKKDMGVMSEKVLDQWYWKLPDQ